MIDKTTVIHEHFDENIKLGIKHTQNKSFNVESWKRQHRSLSKRKICPQWRIRWNIPTFSDRLDKKTLLHKVEEYIYLNIELREYEAIHSLFNIIDIIKRHKVVSLFSLSQIAYNLGNLKYNDKNNHINEKIKDWIHDNEDFYKIYSYINLNQCKSITRKNRSHKGGGKEPSVPPAMVQGYKYGATSANEEAVLKNQYEAEQQTSMLNGSSNNESNDNGNHFQLIKGGGHTIPQFDAGNVEGPSGTQDSTVNNAELLLKAQENSRYDAFDPKDTHKGGKRKKRYTKKKRKSK